MIRKIREQSGYPDIVLKELGLVLNHTFCERICLL
jgi:hypothetical protein